VSFDEYKGILLVLLLVFGMRAFSAKKAVAVIFTGVVTSLYITASPGAFVVIGTVLLLLVLSTPLFVTLGVLSFVCFYFLATEYQHFEDYRLIIEKIFTLTDKNVLLAIPYFIIAGSLMTAGGIARRIVEFADALVGWLPGGMAAAAVLSCMFFAAISGSSPVTVIAIGSIMMPALLKSGYSEKFSLGLVTSAGSLGILIPPSIPMIIYAIMVAGTMSVNVADLFLAGIGPGFIIGGLLIAYSVYHGATRPDFSWKAVKPPSGKVIFEKFLNGFWALLLPVIILGGIYPVFGPRGLFTPTEAAAVAVVYAFVVEMFIHRELSLPKLPALLVDSTIMMGSLLIILILSFALNHYLVDQQIPDEAVTWMTSLELDRVTFLLLLNVFLLLIGCLMDIMSAIMIVAPLVAPIAESFGISPVHLGVIFVVNLEIGYLTPPIGLNLFVSATLFDKSIGYVIRSIVPFTLLMLLGLGVVTWYEPASMGIVRTLRGESFFATPEYKPKPRIIDSDDDDEDFEDDDESDDEDETTSGDGVQSLQELMKAARQKTATSTEVDEEPEDEDSDEDEESTDGEGVKSLQQLMKEAREKAEADDEASDDEDAEYEDSDDDDDDESTDGEGVKSLQQLMKEAREKAKKKGITE